MINPHNNEGKSFSSFFFYAAIPSSTLVVGRRFSRVSTTLKQGKHSLPIPRSLHNFSSKTLGSLVYLTYSGTFLSYSVLVANEYRRQK